MFPRCPNQAEATTLLQVLKITHRKLKKSLGLRALAAPKWLRQAPRLVRDIDKGPIFHALVRICCSLNAADEIPGPQGSLAGSAKHSSGINLGMVFVFLPVFFVFPVFNKQTLGNVQAPSRLNWQLLGSCKLFALCNLHKIARFLLGHPEGAGSLGNFFWVIRFIVYVKYHIRPRRRPPLIACGTKGTRTDQLEKNTVS